MKSFNTKLLIISIILAGIAAYLGYSYLKEIEEASMAEPKLIKIIVAAQNIPGRTKIDSSMIKEIEINEESYLLSSIQDRSEIIGRFTKEEILEGELIPRQRLIQENTEELSLRIKEGKRAISISMSEMSGVGDLIIPGDYVDVYVTLDEYIIDRKTNQTIYPHITKLLLQNIKVLAISKEMLKKEEQRAEIPSKYSVTLAVDSSEGEKLVQAEDLGRIKLALRPLKDKDTHNTPGAIRSDIVPDKGKLIIQK